MLLIWQTAEKQERISPWPLWFEFERVEHMFYRSDVYELCQCLGVVTLFPPCTTMLYSQRKFRSDINSIIVINNKERNKIGEKKNKVSPPEMSNSQQNLDFRRMLPAYRYKAVKSPFCALELIPPLKKKILYQSCSLPQNIRGQWLLLIFLHVMAFNFSPSPELGLAGCLFSHEN